MAKSKYSIKEIYYTLQGEAFHTGRPAIFCRFSGCNLWSGREEDRHKAICKFCDTDFWGTDGLNGGKYKADTLAEKIMELWPLDEKPFIVFTGGEPALQLDEALISELNKVGAEIAIETNGTIELPKGIDWICVSPKANTEIIVKTGQELKIVYPQKGINPLDFADWNFEHFYIQPMDNEKQEENIKASIKFCKQYPQFKLSVQTHKFLDIP
ncbi:MAG: 7-carboxy-7-deazaguanine synthase [Saprospiraceae bacterium]|nr:7-carboxy-7-deazaguanine synthase [Saprospiraceae bacterium]